MISEELEEETENDFEEDECEEPEEAKPKGNKC